MMFYFCRIFQGCYLASSDLKAMYLHVKIKEEFQTDFGFSIEIEGKTIFFKFCSVPFGLNEAGKVMDDLTKPLKFYAHSHSLDMSGYVDDFVEVYFNSLQCEYAHKFIMRLWAYAGWETNKLKSTTIPTQKLLYLGFNVDSAKMLISAPQSKIERLIDIIDELLRCEKDKIVIKCKFLAKILGCLAHLLTSHGNLMRIVSRCSQNELGVQVCRGGWDSSLFVSEDMAREMRLTITYLSR